jgi:hypothetical protein
MSVLAERGSEGYMGQVGGAESGVGIGTGEQQQQQGDRDATSFDSNSSGSGTMGGIGGGADALAGLSEQARITAAVMGVPYVPDLEHGMVENLAAVGIEAATSAGQEQQQQQEGMRGQQGRGGGEGSASMSLGGYIASAAAEATTAAAANEGVARGGDPVTVSEERVLIRVSPDLDSSSQGREGSEGPSLSEGSESAQGFSGGRVYDSTGSADFSSELWGPGVGEVVKEAEYYAYRSVDDAGISGIGRRSSTGHRGSRQRDEDSA